MVKILAILLLSASSAGAVDFYTAPEYQVDFSHAIPCRLLLADRIVWRGAEAFYIQSKPMAVDNQGTLQGGFVDVVYMHNTDRALAPFRKACS